MPPPFYKCALEAKFEDEIDGLQKWPFLVFFYLFLVQFFIVTHIYWQTMYISQKNSLVVFSWPQAVIIINCLLRAQTLYLVY